MLGFAQKIAQDVEVTVRYETLGGVSEIFAGALQFQGLTYFKSNSKISKMCTLAVKYG